MGASLTMEGKKVAKVAANFEVSPMSSCLSELAASSREVLVMVNMKDQVKTLAESIAML